MLKHGEFQVFASSLQDAVKEDEVLKLSKCRLGSIYFLRFK